MHLVFVNEEMQKKMELGVQTNTGQLFWHQYGPGSENAGKGGRAHIRTSGLGKVLRYCLLDIA